MYLEMPTKTEFRKFILAEMYDLEYTRTFVMQIQIRLNNNTIYFSMMTTNYKTKIKWLTLD